MALSAGAGIDAAPVIKDDACTKRSAVCALPPPTLGHSGFCRLSMASSANRSWSSITRRQWLRGGGATVASLLVPRVLRAREATRAAGRGKSSPAQAAIVLYLQGGMWNYERLHTK